MATFFFFFAWVSQKTVPTRLERPPTPDGAHDMWCSDQWPEGSAQRQWFTLQCWPSVKCLNNYKKLMVNWTVHQSRALSDLRASCLMYTCKLKKLKKPKSDLGKVMKFHVEGGGGSAAKAEGRDSGQLWPCPFRRQCKNTDLNNQCKCCTYL